MVCLLTMFSIISIKFSELHPLNLYSIYNVTGSINSFWPIVVLHETHSGVNNSIFEPIKNRCQFRWHSLETVGYI